MGLHLIKHAYKHWKTLLLSASVATMLIACEGNTSPEVVAFGDSLTDGGTYKPGLAGGVGTPTIGSMGGGKFTTNSATAKTWAEVVAESYGNTLTPAANEGFSQGYVPLTGKNYAQGGSMVQSEHPTGRNQPGVGPFQASKTPVKVQLDRFLAANNSFKSYQLVLVSAGANDVFVALQNAGTTAPEPVILAAADDLAYLIAKMQLNGASKIAVANLPDMGVTPAAGTNAALLSYLSNAFNTRLKNRLDQSGVTYAWVDSYTWINTVVASPATYGITNTTGMACNVAALPGNSSLFCSAASLVAPGADQTYAFADDVHPTTKMHQLYGEYALSILQAAGY